MWMFSNAEEIKLTFSNRTEARKFRQIEFSRLSESSVTLFFIFFQSVENVEDEDRGEYSCCGQLNPGEKLNKRQREVRKGSEKNGKTAEHRKFHLLLPGILHFSFHHSHPHHIYSRLGIFKKAIEKSINLSTFVLPL